jgi:hypothetical protein
MCIELGWSGALLNSFSFARCAKYGEHRRRKLGSFGEARSREAQKPVYAHTFFYSLRRGWMVCRCGFKIKLALQ